jgi:hypothetical protein
VDALLTYYDCLKADAEVDTDDIETKLLCMLDDMLHSLIVLGPSCTTCAHCLHA